MRSLIRIQDPVSLAQTLMLRGELPEEGASPTVLRFETVELLCMAEEFAESRDMALDWDTWTTTISDDGHVIAMIAVL